MEVKALYGFTLLLVLVGMVIGVGVLTLDKFSTSVYSNDDGGTQNDIILWTENFTATTATTITGSTLTAVNSTNGAAVTVLCNEVTSNWKCTGVKLISPASANGSAINLSYTYGVNSDATTALVNSRAEIATIASTWLSLIVTIGILAIILTLVIRSFAGGRN